MKAGWASPHPVAAPRGVEGSVEFCSPGPPALWICSLCKAADLVVQCLGGAFRRQPFTPDGVHQLPLLSVHFPPFFVVFFFFFSQLTFSLISFTSHSVLVFLFWLGQVQTLLLCLCLVMFLMMSSFSIFWVTPVIPISFCSQNEQEFTVYEVLWGVCYFVGFFTTQLGFF